MTYLVIVYREHRDSHIIQEVNKSAANANRDDLAKRRIGFSANDQFEPGRKLLFDHHPGDPAAGSVAWTFREIVSNARVASSVVEIPVITPPGSLL